MLSEEEIVDLILTLKVYRKQKSLMWHNQKYLQHIIETLEYIINPSIIKKGINPDNLTSVDIIRQVQNVVKNG